MTGLSKWLYLLFKCVYICISGVITNFVLTCAARKDLNLVNIQTIKVTFSNPAHNTQMSFEETIGGWINHKLVCERERELTLMERDESVQGTKDLSQLALCQDVQLQHGLIIHLQAQVKRYGGALT